ncbi:MAG: hypothetical protein LBR56_01545, partial [Sporomusaceae bacterium]|nr:hypothetical protein [Sporomusaceae bacterium]
MNDAKIFQVNIGGDFPKQIRRLTRKKKFYSCFQKTLADWVITNPNRLKFLKDGGLGEGNF